MEIRSFDSLEMTGLSEKFLYLVLTICSFMGFLVFLFYSVYENVLFLNLTLFGVKVRIKHFPTPQKRHLIFWRKTCFQGYPPKVSSMHALEGCKDRGNFGGSPDE